MNEPIYLDAEYESIRTVMNSRGKHGDQLPSKTVAFIPAERADAVIKLDERIQVMQKWAPLFILGATIIVSFLVGTNF